MPVIRSGRIALITDEPLKGEYGLTHQYVLECQAYPGNSGAPVYLQLDMSAQPMEPPEESGAKRALRVVPPRIALLGVVAAFYPDKQELHTVRRSGRSEIQVYTHFGISTAVPGQKVQEILYSRALIKARKEMVEQKRNQAKSQEPAALPQKEGFKMEDLQAALDE